MFHLFNKIYIKPDADFQDSRDCVIISPKAAKVSLGDDFLDSVTTTDFGTVHYAFNSYDDMIAEFKTLDAFFAWMYNFDATKRLVVYCDSATFVKLIYVWLKTILPNMDAVSSYKLIRLVFYRYRYQWSYARLPYVKISPADAAAYEQIGMSLPSADDVAKTWEATTAVTLPGDVSATTSLEFQLATQFVDNKWTHSQALKDKVVRMIKKSQIRTLMDVKHTTLTRLYGLPDFNLFTQSLLDWVVSNPMYSFLLDNKVLADEYEYVFSSYNMEGLTNVFIHSANEYCGPTSWGECADPTLLANRHFLDPNITYENIIDMEKTSPVRLQLGHWVYSVSVNQYVLDYMFSLLNSNNTAELTKYSLVKV